MLANQAQIPEEFIARYSKIGANPLYLSNREEKYLKSLGTTVIYGDFISIKNGAYLRHNSRSLSDNIIILAEESIEKRRV